MCLQSLGCGYVLGQFLFRGQGQGWGHSFASPIRNRILFTSCRAPLTEETSAPKSGRAGCRLCFGTPSCLSDLRKGHLHQALHIVAFGFAVAY